MSGRRVERVRNPVSQGDAFEATYREHLPTIEKIVWKYTANPSDRDDLLQDASIKAFTNWRTFDPSLSKFTTWFGVIVRNCAIDYYRRRASRSRVTDGNVEIDEIVDPLRGYDSYSSTDNAVRSVMFAKPGQALKDALAWIPAEQREVVELEADGFTHEEMANELREPLGTIKSRIRIARVKLKKLLGARGVTSETLFGT